MEQQAEEENKAPVRGRRWRKRKRSRMPLEKPDPASETTSPQPDPLSLLHPTRRVIATVKTASFKSMIKDLTAGVRKLHSGQRHGRIID